MNAWNDPHLKKAVEATKRKNLIMAGVTTDVCLVFPAISACREGYHVQAVVDASGSPFDISEEMARRRMAKEGVVLTATNTLMAELAQRLEPTRGRPVTANSIRRGTPEDWVTMDYLKVVYWNKGFSNRVKGKRQDLIQTDSKARAKTITQPILRPLVGFQLRLECPRAAFPVTSAPPVLSFFPQICSNIAVNCF